MYVGLLARGRSLGNGDAVAAAPVALAVDVAAATRLTAVVSGAPPAVAAAEASATDAVLENDRHVFN